MNGSAGSNNGAWLGGNGSVFALGDGVVVSHDGGIGTVAGATWYPVSRVCTESKTMEMSLSDMIWPGIISG